MTDLLSPTPEDREIIKTYLRYWRLEANLLGPPGRRWWRVYIRPTKNVHNWRKAKGIPEVRGPIGHGFNKDYQRAVRFAVRRALSWWRLNRKRLPSVQRLDALPPWVGTEDEQLARGRANEQRALAILQRTAFPAWMKGARAGTPEEDARGIDLVVDSTVGPLYLQIKSSVRGRDKFFEMGYPDRIRVVIVNEEVQDWRLRVRLLRTVERLWHEGWEDMQRKKTA